MAERYGPKPKRGADWNFGGKNWKLSRSKIDLFSECQRCFYIDNVLGVARPKMPSFTLNIAVDGLLKKEFDLHRANGSKHPLIEKYGVDAVPFRHADINTWRENFVGIQYRHADTGFLITGAIDDVWVNPAGELIVVDYKATSKDGKMEKLEDTQWENQYKRQMEVYQWLLRKKGFTVSPTGYFVYVNGKKDLEAFDGRLEFDVTLIPHKGDDSWIEGILLEIKECLQGQKIPASSKMCDYCNYMNLMRDALFAQTNISKENEPEKAVKTTGKTLKSGQEKLSF